MALNGLLVVLFQFQISKWATDKPVGEDDVIWCMFIWDWIIFL